MAINEELKAQILRYHFVEHWRVGTIAFQLAIHHSTVERVLGEAGVERERRRPRRPSKLDPYMAFITETLERFPTLTAARLFDMVKARGYPGAPDHFRHRIAQLRARRPREAYRGVGRALVGAGGEGARQDASRHALAASPGRGRCAPCLHCIRPPAHQRAAGLPGRQCALPANQRVRRRERDRTQSVRSWRDRHAGHTRCAHDAPLRRNGMAASRNANGGHQRVAPSSVDIDDGDLCQGRCGDA